MEFGCKPSSVEVLVVVVIVVWLRAYPSVVRWLFERGVQYSIVVKILLGEGSLGGSPRWTV